VFHLRARPGRRKRRRRRSEGRGAQRARARAARTYGFLGGGRAVNKFAIFPRVRSSHHPTPAPATIPRDELSSSLFFSFSLSKRRIHERTAARPAGKGTAGRDYTDNKLTRTTLSRRIIHHEGYVRARPDSATRAYLRRAPAATASRYGGFAH